jgi:hypothetical protein
MPRTDHVKPIPRCRFCCVPVEKRGRAFLVHPRCTSCDILMGPGHIEDDAGAELCSTCARTWQRQKALR